MFNRSFSVAALTAGVLALSGARTVLAQDNNLPENLGLGLREMLRDYRQTKAFNFGTASVGTTLSVISKYEHAQSDVAARVLVDVYLDGTTGIAMASRNFTRAFGCETVTSVDWYRNGVISLYVPLDTLGQLAVAPGVSAVQLAPKPIFHASATGTGVTASQGQAVHKTKALNALGYDGSTNTAGAPIAVGALSDSYDRLGAAYPVHAAQGVAAGDLPGTGNPDGYTLPVQIVQETGTGPTDEGRGMLEIIHDIAPAARLAFATANSSQANFANNILALAAPVGTTTTAGKAGAGCNVICDDVGYFAEPMYSDGVIAQAIDTVSAQGVAYFSSAGNSGNSGYSAIYTPVANNTAAQSLLTAQGVTYTSLTTAEQGAIESFHSFGKDASGNDILVQNVVSVGAAGTLVFQWNDPFSVTVGTVKQVTTDYDILVFNGTTGAFLSGRSGIANNPSTNQPIEQPGTTLAVNTAYKIVLARTNRAVGTGVTRNQANDIRYVCLSGDITGDFINPNNVETYGHNCAATCNGAAAYAYDIAPNPSDPNHPYTPGVETFSSNGPSKIYFDKAGNRLTTPVSRRQPVLAAVDGVNTSFFPATSGETTPPYTGNPNDYDGDGFPNFFGTSAAAPHGAGVAAVLLSAAAKNGIALSPADVTALLTSTTQGTIDQDPGFIQGTTAGGAVNLSGRGDSSTDPNTFKVSFNGAAGQTLTTLVFDVTGTGVHFDADATTGYPVTVGTTTGSTPPTLVSSAVTAGSGGFNTVLTLTFSNFVPGDTLTFGVDRDNDASNAYGNGVDQLQGAAIRATISTNGVANTVNGTLANAYSRKWNYKAGYGLIDAQAAVTRLLGQ